MKTDDLMGKKIGLLHLLKKESRGEAGKKRIYIYCKCDCGNFKWIRADALTKKNPTESCGCLSEETKFKMDDITNKRFGRLIAINPTENRDKYNGAVIWKCKCDCGNITYVSISNLQKGSIVSCGCYKKEYQVNHGQEIGEINVKRNIKDGTNIRAISRTKLLKNNKSGVTGVCWDKACEKWVAQIEFKKKHYNLGKFKNKKDAIAAREKAKEELHNKYLREIEKEK